MELNIDTITFGKYKNKTLKEMLKDRKYCKWFLSEPELKTKYEYIYNKVKEYEPRIYFLPIQEIIDSDNFLDKYIYFNLTPLDKLALNLTENEKKCYKFYLKTITELKQKILDRIEDAQENPYDIKAPTKWLQKFESDYGLKREEFKEFINSYDLPNIPYIIEDIKKEGGIVYNGANSFNIAKERSGKQENFWSDILKEKYGEDIGVQYKYDNCIFDFLNISTNTIYECKLNIKDFNEEQYKKYLLILNKYKIIYLIDKDCIIDIDNKIIYTLDTVKYMLYISKIPLMQKPSNFDEIIVDFKIKEIKNITEII
jgi:hypothetical protein